MICRWFRRSRAKKAAAGDRETVLVAAEEEVARIRERADRVGPLLERRLRRNHWGAAVQAIARREH